MRAEEIGRSAQPSVRRNIQLDALKQYAVGDSAMKWITLRGSGVYEPDEPTLVTS